MLREFPAHRVGRYIDDIVLGGRTTDELLRWEMKAFAALHEAGFTLNTEKTKRHVDQAAVLGFQIQKGEIRIPGEKRDEIRSIPSPRNVKEVRRFMGMVNYFSRLIPSLQLTKLVKNQQPSSSFRPSLANF